MHTEPHACSSTVRVTGGDANVVHFSYVSRRCSFLIEASLSEARRSVFGEVESKLFYRMLLMHRASAL